MPRSLPHRDRKLTDDEKAALKEGRIPKDWQGKSAKLAQKDRDARWTLKRGRKKQAGDHARDIAVPVFSYKKHIGTDVRHGFIRRWCVGRAAEHDIRRFRELLDQTNTASSVGADTAYRSAKNECHLERRGLVSKIHFRRSPGKPLNPQRSKANAARSQIRARVEHVFATQKGPMDLCIRTIGLDRATTKIAIANLIYNFKRLVCFERQVEAT